MISKPAFSVTLRASSEAFIFRGQGAGALHRWSVILAFVATIMLVIAGGPTLAVAAICDPCPPDCPMMLPDTAMALAPEQPDEAPADDRDESPCQQTVLCPATTVVAALTTAAPLPAPLFTSNRHGWLRELPAISRPPDRSLRPPIQL